MVSKNTPAANSESLSMFITLFAFFVLCVIVWNAWARSSGGGNSAADTGGSGAASYDDEGSFAHGVHEEQGQRAYMEDRWAVCGDLRRKGAPVAGAAGSDLAPLGGGWASAATSLYGVFDGHGGELFLFFFMPLYD